MLLNFFRQTLNDVIGMMQRISGWWKAKNSISRIPFNLFWVDNMLKMIMMMIIIIPKLVLQVVHTPLWCFVKGFLGKILLIMAIDRWIARTHLFLCLSFFLYASAFQLNAHLCHVRNEIHRQWMIRRDDDAMNEWQWVTPPSSTRRFFNQ